MARRQAGQAGQATPWTPARLDALRLALRAEATAGYPLAQACLAAIREQQGEAVCLVKAAKLATLLRRGDPTAQAMWRRVSARARRLLASEAGA